MNHNKWKWCQNCQNNNQVILNFAKIPINIIGTTGEHTLKQKQMVLLTGVCHRHACKCARSTLTALLSNQCGDTHNKKKLSIMQRHSNTKQPASEEHLWLQKTDLCTVTRFKFRLNFQSNPFSRRMWGEIPFCSALTVKCQTILKTVSSGSLSVCLTARLGWNRSWGAAANCLTLIRHWSLVSVDRLFNSVVVWTCCPVLVWSNSVRL